MIYLEHTRQVQTVAIPLQRGLKVGAIVLPVYLILHGTVSLRNIRRAIGDGDFSPRDFNGDFALSSIDSIEQRGDYAFITLRLPQMPEGSCEYALMAGWTVLATGCAQIGDYEHYEGYNTAIEYKTHESEIEYTRYGEE